MPDLEPQHEFKGRLPCSSNENREGVRLRQTETGSQTTASTANCDPGTLAPISPPPRNSVTAPQHTPHLAEWLTSLSQNDTKRLQVLINLRPETVAWINARKDRELKNLDGAVEFITSSGTAARVLMWVGGMAVAFVGGVTALAKNGIDLFAMRRGGR